MRRPDSVTIREVATRAGVHVSTVSRALDPARRHLISADALRRVERAAQALGYRPNRAAAALRTGRTRSIGVLLPDITNPVFPPILRGIEDALGACGYFALVANVGATADAPAAELARAARAVVERMLAQRVDGFILATSVRRDPLVRALHDSGAAVVLVNRTDDSRALPAVISDDAVGMQLAVDHLAGLGHRRIAHLAGPLQTSTGLARKLGFERALAAHRLAPAAVVPCHAYSREAGTQGFAALIKSRRRFTALVAANDLLAIGALEAARARRLNVPRDFSLVGHNDMPLVDLLTPPLTTVRIQHYEMGARAARLLLEVLEGERAAATVVLRPELVVRGSTRRAPA
jgi:LacI family transcriptional regulator